MNIPDDPDDLQSGYVLEVTEHPKSELDRVATDFTTPNVNLYQEFIRYARKGLASITTIPLIDISKWNLGGDMDVMVLAGWEIVIIKASEALGPDPVFPAHVQAAIEAGALILVYHFFRSNIDGTAQAIECLRIINPLLAPYQNKTLVLCDIETADGVSNSVRIVRVKNFLDTICAGGHEAGMYCSPALWQQLMSPTPAWTNDYWQWCAHWTSASLPTLPAGWTFARCILWQIGVWNNQSWCGPVPGWNPDIDCNKAFASTRQEFMDILGIYFITVPPPPDPDPVPPPLPKARVIETDGIRVRKKHDTTSSSIVLAVLPYQTIVDVAKMVQIGDDVWVDVIGPNDEVGWSAWEYQGDVNYEWL